MTSVKAKAVTTVTTKAPTRRAEKKGVKPDYLDFDKDGNKEEPMKDALKSKKEVKEENLEENRMAS